MAEQKPNMALATYAMLIDPMTLAVRPRFSAVVCGKCGRRWELSVDEAKRYSVKGMPLHCGQRMDPDSLEAE